MASKKNRPAPLSEAAAFVADDPEYATAPLDAAANVASSLSEADRDEQIRQIAYAAYERRGEQDGDAIQDWLAAEAEWENKKSG